MSYSTLPGSEAYRHNSRGAYYVNALDQQLRDRDNSGRPLDRVLMKVTGQVRKEIGQDLSEHQLPFHIYTSDKLLYLGNRQ